MVKDNLSNEKVLKSTKKNNVLNKYEQSLVSLTSSNLFFEKSVTLFVFFTYILGVFLTSQISYFWGGSVLTFSFIFCLYSLYLSFYEEKSRSRTLQIVTKYIILLSELLFFYLLVKGVGSLI